MDSNPAAARKKRSVLLDCIRATAVSMVVIYHVAVEFPFLVQDWFADFLATYGLLGVDIFFPLSGYLVTRFLLRRHTEQDIRVFFLRRFFRIVPLYFVALLIYLIASLIFRREPDIIINLWQNALFLTGWSIFHLGRDTVPYTITWSLSVEEFAYLTIGISALFLRHRLVAALLTLFLFSLLLRLGINMQGLPDSYFYPPARLDSVALGGLIAWAGHNKFRVIVPLLAGLATGLLLSQLGKTVAATMLYVNISIVTCLAIQNSETHFSKISGPVSSAIASLGFYSYFIYLFHYFNIAFAALLLERLDVLAPFWLLSGAILGVSYAQAWISFRIFEGPLIAFGHRLEN